MYNSVFVLAAEAGTKITVADALTSAKTVFSWVMDIVTTEPLLAAAFAMTVLVPAGVMVFRKIKHSV